VLRAMQGGISAQKFGLLRPFCLQLYHFGAAHTLDF
jgi:hypothetical protein